MRRSRPTVRPVVLLLAVAVLGGCSSGSGSTVTSGQPVPTALRGSGPAVGVVARSRPVKDVAESAVMVSTSGAVVLAGGYEGQGERPSASARVFNRGTGAWRSLPPLPKDLLVQAGAAVDDVPYLLAAPCQAVSVEQPDPDLSERCNGIVVLRLVDDASAWEVLAAPSELSTDNVTEMGRLGRHSLAMLSGNSPYRAGLVVLDVDDGSWQSVPLPEGADGSLVITCFTEGSLLLRTLGDALNQGSSGDSATPEEQYSFRVWGRIEDRWLGPVEVDLGLVRPVQGSGASQLCADGAFTASNVSGGGNGVSLRVKGDTVSAADLETSGLGTVPTGPARGAVSPSGAVLSNQGDEVANLTPAGTVDPALSLERSDETATTLDLLVTDPSTPTAVRVISVGRRP